MWLTIFYKESHSHVRSVGHQHFSSVAMWSQTVLDSSKYGSDHHLDKLL